MQNKIVHYGQRHKIFDEMKQYRQLNLPGRVVFVDAMDRAVAVLEFTLPTYIAPSITNGVWDIAFLWTNNCEPDYRPQ